MVQTVQQVVAAFPVTFNAVPPEGQKAISFVVTLSSTTLTYANFFNLQSLLVSQIVTAIIDNTQSDVDITVSAGITNTNTVIPAGGGVIIPVFSSGPTFNLIISANSIPS